MLEQSSSISAQQNWSISKLGIHDLDTIYDFECSAWPEPLQASKQTLLKRLELNHFMLGVWQQKQLIGLASWRRGWLDLDKSESFPHTFDAFSSTAHANPYNAAFAYNLSIHPDKRGTAMTRALMMAVLEEARRDGCKYLVGDGRCPSYNGSDSVTENIHQSPSFHAAINQYFNSGISPTLEDYLADSTLRFYHRMLDCNFLWVMQNFIQSDTPSGGHRVIFYKQLIK